MRWITLIRNFAIQLTQQLPLLAKELQQELHLQRQLQKPIIPANITVENPSALLLKW